MSSNDCLKAIQHAFQRSVAAATTSSSQNTGRRHLVASSQPAQNVTKQNTSQGLASTVPETQAIVDVGNPSPPAIHAGQAQAIRPLKKMSTQGSLPQDTQPVSPSIYESILSKAKIVRQPEQGSDNTKVGDGVDQDSLQAGDEGHIDLLSSYKAQELGVSDDSDSEPVDFSPTQPQQLLSQFPESQRFKTPGTTSKKRNYDGELVESPSLPRNPLAPSRAPTADRMMGLSQVFAATQAVSSTPVKGLLSGPLSDRPSPNIELQTWPATATRLSPLRPSSDLRRTATEPLSHYKSIKQSQAERERLSLFGQQDGDAIGENVSDDDFDQEPSLLELRRRLKEREENVQQQLQAVCSSSRPRSRGSAGPWSSPTTRPKRFLSRISPGPDVRNTARTQDLDLNYNIPNEADNEVTDLNHDSEEDTEQEDEVQIARSSQTGIRTEEDKENLRFAGLQIPDTVARLQSPINGHIGIESSPLVRHLAGSDRKIYRLPESNDVEPVAVANSQPSQPTRRPGHPPHIQFTSSGDSPSFVPLSQGQPCGTPTSSSQAPGILLELSSKTVGGEVAARNAKPKHVVERTSNGNELLQPTWPGQVHLEKGSGGEVNEGLAATAHLPIQISNEIAIAETADLAAMDRLCASRHAPMTETTIPETSSLGRIESGFASSAPQLDRSKPPGSSSGQVPRSSTEFETAETHISTATGAVPPSLLRQPSYVTASPSGRKRRRPIDITADPSPCKSGSELDMDGVIKTIEDEEFERINGNLSPILSGRHLKRRRLQERQPDSIVEKKRPTVAADQDTVMQEPEQWLPTGTEDAELADGPDVNDNDSLGLHPEAAQPVVRSTNIKHRLTKPTPKLSDKSVDSQASRRDPFNIPPSPDKPEVARPKMLAAKTSRPPSIMPARKAHTSIPPAGPSSSKQTGRSLRPGSRGAILIPSESPDLLEHDASEDINSGSDVPLGDVIAPNQVLACFNGKTRAYYPATCLGISGSDTLRYRIKWEGFEVDETDARGIRTLDLRIGDAVKVDLKGFPKVSHIIRGFKDKVLPSSKDGPLTDIRGYSVLLLAPKQRKSLPANLGVDAIKEVPVSAIYLDSNMWGHMKGREYEYTPQQDLSALGFVTPPDRPATPATPTSRSRRNLASSTSIAPIDPVGILAGMAFAVSYDDARKVSLTHLIRANGGVVLQDGFHELFTSDSISPRSNYANIGFTALLADRHSRKEKYMQALALNLPCLSGKWIESCIAKERIVDWQPYLLPAGESSLLDGATRSRILPALTDPSSVKMLDMIMTRTTLLNDSAVIFVTGRGKAEEKRKAFVFLTQAIGAGQIEKVADLRAAKALLDDNGNQGKGYQWVFVDDSQVDMAKAMLGHRQGFRVVGNEFICQSLILGGLVDE